MTDVLDELQWRGLIAQHTDLGALRAALDDGPVSYYCGFDPTAASLHHGHLVQLLLLRHLQNAGHHPIALVGGATGMIGDPRMSGERKLNTAETVAEWTERLREQVSRFLSFEGDNAATVVNNMEWTAGLTAIELLRDVGQHFRMSAMLAKDTVATRLASSEGLSYTEFSYQLLQGMDFLELYRRHGVTLQTGGNDQWGNLVSGLDLIRKVEGAPVHVLTTPLITKADGTKFGKTEGGAVWLAPDMMSPYAFYQFWLNTADDDVVRFLKIFTFRTREEIEALEAEVAERPFARVGQKVLAEDVTTLVHGPEATARAQAASAAVFGKGDLRELDADTLRDATAELPRARGEVGESSVVDLLVATGLEAGRGAARRTIASGGASINAHKIDDDERLLTADDLLAGGVVVLRKGKKSMAIVETQRD
ncbi:tyrosine--tRNA ligase [Georgenia sp. Z1344]|uniref:tyrosine--tRNA ligase n=1 Tax=Georgenia sp. Z1344 TaxID=3416706 RepID=UPI003CFB12D3